jgi:hypothetical protein
VRAERCGGWPGRPARSLWNTTICTPLPLANRGSDSGSGAAHGTLEKPRAPLCGEGLPATRPGTASRNTTQPLRELGFRQSFTLVRTPETSDLGMIEAYGVPPGVKRIPVSLAGLAPLETIGELGGPLRGGVFLAFASGGLGKQRGPGYLLTPGPHMQREGHQI